MAKQEHARIGDTYWGVAAKTDAETLMRIGRRFLQARPGFFDDRWDVIEGTTGLSVLIIGDPSPADDDLALFVVSALGTRAYLLDFDDHCQSVQWFEGEKHDYFMEEGASEDTTDPAELERDLEHGAQWLEDPPGFRHPADFLREHGIVVPGYGPLPPSTVRTVCVVEGATPEECLPYFQNPKTVLTATPRGTLASGEVGVDAWTCAEELGGPVYELRRHPEEDWFACTIHVRGQEKPQEFFTKEMANPDMVEQVFRVLDETTPEGIVRALGVPPELLFGEG